MVRLSTLTMIGEPRLTVMGPAKVITSPGAATEISCHKLPGAPSTGDVTKCTLGALRLGSATEFASAVMAKIESAPRRGTNREIFISFPVG